MVTLDEFKKEYIIKTELGIDVGYGKIIAIIDFGNVNYWFEEDRQDADNKSLANDEKLRINLDGLKSFTSLFSEHIRFYYGHDPQNKNSMQFLTVLRYIFGKKVFTKAMQKVRHHLTIEELGSNTRNIFSDKNGSYVYIPKCNFDVEITVDSIRLMAEYDTLALFSGDADFISLIRFLKQNGKKVILFKAGFITSELNKSVDKVISAQNIKRHITEIVKQKPGI